MGRSRTCHYVIRLITSGPSLTPCEWKYKQSGKPTTANIDKYVTVFENSLTGCNAHLGIFSIVKAVIVDQFRDGEVVATWERKLSRPNEPKFMVI